MKSPHEAKINPDVPPSGPGCAECQATGGWWLHLRRCTECGHIGCCDSSPNQHATKHAHQAHHPIIASYEPGEDWFYDYRSDETFEAEGRCIRRAGIPRTNRPPARPGAYQPIGNRGCIRTTAYRRGGARRYHCAGWLRRPPSPACTCGALDGATAEPRL